MLGRNTTGFLEVFSILKATFSCTLEKCSHPEEGAEQTAAACRSCSPGWVVHSGCAVEGTWAREGLISVLPISMGPSPRFSSDGEGAGPWAWDPRWVGTDHTQPCSQLRRWITWDGFSFLSHLHCLTLVLHTQAPTWAASLTTQGRGH